LSAMPRGNSVCSMADRLALVAIEFIRQSFMADEGME